MVWVCRLLAMEAKVRKAKAKASAGEKTQLVSLASVVPPAESSAG